MSIDQNANQIEWNYIFSFLLSKFYKTFSTKLEWHAYKLIGGLHFGKQSKVKIKYFIYL